MLTLWLWSRTIHSSIFIVATASWPESVQAFFDTYLVTCTFNIEQHDGSITLSIHRPCAYSSSCVEVISKLATDHFGIIVIPTLSANCTPDVISIHLDSTFSFVCSTNQSYCKEIISITNQDARFVTYISLFWDNIFCSIIVNTFVK